MENIKVAIYEDNLSLREVLSTIIRNSQGFELAGEFGHCLDAVQNTVAFQPDVILMDIDMPERSGIEGVKDVKSSYPVVEIIMHLQHKLVVGQFRKNDFAVSHDFSLCDAPKR